MFLKYGNRKLIMKQHLEGLIAAPFTSVARDMNIKLDGISNYCGKLKAVGVKGVFVNGTTGEGLSLALAQRKELAAEWAKYCDDEFKLIVHTGSQSILDCIELTRHADEIGAFATGLMSPCFFKPADIEGLVEFCSKAAAAGDLPFYYYHIPSMTGVDFLMGDFLRKASKQIPNFAGIKYTHYDIMDYMDCCNYENGKYDILYGRDETLLSGLAVGAKGAIGSTYNYMPKIYLEIIDAFNRGDMDEARRFQLISVDIVKILVRSGNPIGVGKAIMKLCGIDLGLPLPPCEALNSEQLSRLETDLTAIKFFDYCIK
jgi:N-acetylneuraminate lyase